MGMHITLAMVMSTDGKITKWFNPHIHEWTSKEDQEHFAKLIERNELIIMGRKTYDVAKKMVKHIPGKLRIIITSKPNDFANEAIPDQLEYTNESPVQLVSRLEKKGYSHALLVGGSEINALFLKENLIDELILTIEPILLGKGNAIMSEIELVNNLQLLSVEKINEKGTLLLRYAILK